MILHFTSFALFLAFRSSLSDCWNKTEAELKIDNSDDALNKENFIINFLVCVDKQNATSNECFKNVAQLLLVIIKSTLEC